MNSTARTWRADGGYQNVPQAAPAAQSAQQQAAMYWPPWYCTQWAGQQCVRGPVPVAGLSSYPAQMPYWQAGYVPPQFQIPSAGTPPPPYPAPAPCDKKEEKTDEKTDEKEEEKVVNPYAPPTLGPGVNYLFDNGHTMLHIFSKAAKIWEPKYEKENL